MQGIDKIHWKTFQAAGETFRRLDVAPGPGQFNLALTITEPVLPLRGMRAMTMRAAHALLIQRGRHVIGPQIFRYALPSASTFAIGLLKDTAIASAIGVPEVALVANQLTQKTFKGLEIYAVAAVCYFALSFAMAYVARIADEKLRARIER